MMNLKRELQMNQLALAAFLLGVFSLNPMARAQEPAPAPAEQQFEEASQRGLSMTELKAIGVTVEIGSDNSLIFKGQMPEACAKSFNGASLSSEGGKHFLMVDMPACRPNLPNPRGKMVTVRSVISPISLEQDGEIQLRYLKTGDTSDATDTPILGKDGKPLIFKSLASIASENQRLAQEASRKLRAEERRIKEERLLKQVGLFCAQGDFHAIGLELEAAREFLGDLTQVLEQIGKAKLKKSEQAFKKAKDPEELKVAYEALIAEGFDAEDALKQYVTRRLEMGKELVAGTTKSVSDVESGIRDLESDLRDVDVFEENKAAITWLFVELGNRERDDKNYDGAESQYNKAMRTADLKGKVKIEQEMAKMFLAAAEACQDENKTKLAKCDALAKKAEKHMNGAITLQGRMKGEDSLAELNGMKAEKIQQFGVSTVKVKVTGFGEYNPYGGAFAQRKVQMYQTGMQEEYMKRMMQQQMGGAGAQNLNGASTGFFR